MQTDNIKNNNFLFEYAGRSTSVLRISYVLMNLLLDRYRKTEWMPYSGNSVYYKVIILNVSKNEELSPYLENVYFHVFLIPDDVSSDDFATSCNFSLDSAMNADKKALTLNVVMHKGENFQNELQGLMEHELMHAFQNAKSRNGLKTSDLYSKSAYSINDENGENMTNNQYDAVKIMSSMPYYFSKVEIDANIQKIWSEMVRVGDYKKCPTYYDTYYKAMRRYKKIKSLYDENTNEEVNKAFIDNYIKRELEISPLQYFKTVDNGIKRFKTKLGKLIAYYDSIMESRSIDKIITEAIDKYLSENVFDESLFMEKKKKSKTKKKHRKSDDIKVHSIKRKGGSRGDFDVKKDKTINPNINNQDAKELSNILDSDYVNLAAVAREVYPGHSPVGAQSVLRKKVKRLKSDSGSRYKIKKKEADRIRRSLVKNLGKAS